VPTVVVTLGPRGCIAREGEALLHQAGFVVEAVDTTAAGDTFCGSLVAALVRGAPLADGLREACAASALACTRLGAQASIPTQDEVQALLATHAERGA
jgi:ribokinase